MRRVLTCLTMAAVALGASGCQDDQQAPSSAAVQPQLPSSAAVQSSTSPMPSPAAKTTETLKPLAADATYANVEDVAQAIRHAGVDCDEIVVNRSTAGCDTGAGGHLTFYVESASASAQRVSVMRSNPLGCGQPGIPGVLSSSRILEGDGWMILDSQGSSANEVQSGSGRRMEAVCA